ncbi:hypothetical protein METBIDRAFT_45275 [Metschnikowia bicuspidata var. bicuspidata NRRL YB-4993]|uniref:Probable 26S proteasome regulatory subunit p27 n=1 Tax=Metschnikowia bicuspidata var. bicuspidata NRRL YB-4993 TaxID=869754 RepID=A0A1A0H7W2_9ASCO|nr:hypothetical protein METBIDRAFT_45275 [Metschnikowia bicuspidata var. bicuspidata NRRL YB-4993]OBA19988.1 hypothetical protein METBIDRAFT_45275 [Metschnikowia bicuspidata var. bicuspidata NRRL YB-4993]
MIPNHVRQNESLSGEMKSLNLDVPEYSGDFLSMTYSQLAEVKQLIETSVDHLYTLLNVTYKFDMDLPLVIDGFPRNDVDVVTVRLIRSKIIRLRNDHSAILGQLQLHLVQQLSGNKKLSTDELEKPHNGNFRNEDSRISKVFAVVKGVDPNGPAAKAGLLVGDKIITFDENIDIQNHANLTAVAKRVKEKEDIRVSIEILRAASVETLLLVPTENWAGRGLLGCHIVPM